MFALIINLISRWNYNRRAINGGTRRETPICRPTGINCCRVSYRNVSRTPTRTRENTNRDTISASAYTFFSPTSRPTNIFHLLSHKGSSSPSSWTLEGPRWSWNDGASSARNSGSVRLRIAVIILEVIFARRKREEGRKEGRKEGRRWRRGACGQGDRKFEGRQRWVQKRRINVAPNVGPKPNYAN